MNFEDSVLLSPPFRPPTDVDKCLIVYVEHTNARLNFSLLMPDALTPIDSQSINMTIMEAKFGSTTKYNIHIEYEGLVIVRIAGSAGSAEYSTGTIIFFDIDTCLCK